MTHSGGKPHAVGDRGQQYEVTYRDSDGRRHVMGWCSTLEGARSFANSIRLHPSMDSPHIRDRWICPACGANWKEREPCAHGSLPRCVGCLVPYAGDPDDCPGCGQSLLGRRLRGTGTP